MEREGEALERAEQEVPAIEESDSDPEAEQLARVCTICVNRLHQVRIKLLSQNKIENQIQNLKFLNPSQLIYRISGS